VIGDAQALEEALPGFEVIAEIESVAGPFAAQDESAAALAGQDPEKIGDDGRVA